MFIYHGEQKQMFKIADFSRQTTDNPLKMTLISEQAVNSVPAVSSCVPLIAGYVLQRGELHMCTF